MSKQRRKSLTYGGALAQKLRPRHVTSVLANEIRMRCSSLIIPRLGISQKSFMLWDAPTKYFLHPYNTTWRNERAVELAALKVFLSENSHGRLFEFGNVLQHYGLARPDLVVDLYEKGERVVNVDIVDFTSPDKFDSVVSISTIEHVGWDEWPRSETKSSVALSRLVSLLKPGGRMFITAPTGHNPHLDKLIENGIPNTVRQVFFVRDGFEWSPTDEFTAKPYGSCGPGAATIWVAEISAG